jgi:hypothetical protein
MRHLALRALWLLMELNQADSSLHSALGMVCIPTVVSGLADMYVSRDFTKKPGEGVSRPDCWTPPPTDLCPGLLAKRR